MLEFNDKDYSLQWRIVGIHDLAVCDKERDMVNLWASPDIKKYLSTYQPVAELFYTYLGRNGNICYCYMDRDSFEGKVSSTDIVKIGEEEKILAGATMLYQPFNEKDALSIEGLVVNPKLVGKGIATRMVGSIRDNPNVFGNSLHKGDIVAAVNNENIASRKALLKNKFKPMGKPTNYLMYDSVTLFAFKSGREKEK